MSTSCSIYGLGLWVNVPIAGLVGLPVPERIDVRMTLGELPEEVLALPSDGSSNYYESPSLDERGNPGLRVTLLAESGYYKFTYSDGTIVLVSLDGSTVWATVPADATIEDTATYLLGPVLGFVLRLRGVTSLHASAIAVDGCAIAFVGPSESGKSSTAAAFARLGYPVMTDDVLALSDQGNRFLVQPAYPRVRLWAESVSALFGSTDALPLITPNWDKRYLDLNGAGGLFQHEMLPLAAIYFLGRRSDAAGMPRVEAVSPRIGLMTLVSDTSTNYLLDVPRRAQEFEVLGRLVANVPLRKLTPSADISRISALCEAVIDDFRKIPASTGHSAPL